ncbi:hypothetical protein [Alistipes sp. ZOR0009]|jgi:hypothetical protein|uniref:hypothetical protein n=1 Tax=Alistipes sp. ZOR0009 TaxID=1339253 RepID=UPI0006464DB2|nr:hypothetical protein [Alistipes sp. ZOR0009]
MRKALCLGIIALGLVGSVSASSNALDGLLVRKSLITEEVKSLMESSVAGDALPVRIVYQNEVVGSFQAFYPTEENFVVVNKVNLENEGGVLVATVKLNINGKKNVEKIFVKNGSRAPWILKPEV